MGKSLFSSIEDSKSTPPSQLEIENPILKRILDRKVSPQKITPFENVSPNKSIISSEVVMPKIDINKRQLPNGISEIDEGMLFTICY